MKENKIEYKKQIEEIIETALTEKTFSLEIIEKIKSLRDGFAEAIEKNKELEEDLRKLRAEHSVTVEKLSKTKLTLEECQIREAELVKREKEQDKKDYELEFQKKRAEEVKELFGIVFRNPTLKESVYKNTTVPISQNGYIQSATGSESEQKTTTTE
jgi:organic radical activating enzyme